MDIHAIRKAADSLVAICDDALEQSADAEHATQIRETADAIMLAIRDGAPLPREDDKLIPDDLRAHIPPEMLAELLGTLVPKADPSMSSYGAVQERMWPAVCLWQVIVMREKDIMRARQGDERENVSELIAALAGQFASIFTATFSDPKLIKAAMAPFVASFMRAALLVIDGVDVEFRARGNETQAGRA